MMIEVENLSKYFGPVFAVRNVSFQVEHNEIVGLLGNNGAGKSTLMRILTTFLPATSGSAKVEGFDVMNDSLEVRRRIGYLPESIPLYPEMRVEEYLNFRARLKGVDRKIRSTQIDKVLEKCRVGEVRRRLLGTLSKGYRQRVGLADALLSDPHLLILDEPTDGLDPEQKVQTLKMLKELGQSHTIVFSSHLLSEVETIVQRVLIMRRGRLAFSGKISEMETATVVQIEARGPEEQIANSIRSLEGVMQVSHKPIGDGLNSFDVRCAENHDIREAIYQRISQGGWSLRRLDQRRKNLQDKWNEINNLDDNALQSAVGSR
ncbi:ATP-binding cassette domain-containing protein [bacterium]|jgi:ABC-2 type transport system ATP-binding protein|nr:ATP-binding cassette domain-containing protein [bacterium]